MEAIAPFGTPLQATSVFAVLAVAGVVFYLTRK
jgi:hypothetical protein